MLPIHYRASEHDGGWTHDDSFFSRSCASEDSGQARQGLLCTGHGPRRARSLHRTRRTIHLAFCRYASFARKTPNHEIQAVDAKRPGALVGRAVPWYRDIHALVCARFIPQVARVAQFMERFLRFIPLWLLTILSVVAQVNSAQSGTASTPGANPGRRTVSTPATLTPIGYLQSENGALSAEHSTEFSRRFGIGQVTKLSVLPRFELLLRSESLAISDRRGV